MSEVPCRVKPDAQRSGFASPMDLQPNPHYSFRIRICFAREPKPEAPGAGVLYRSTVMLIVRLVWDELCCGSLKAILRLIGFQIGFYIEKTGFSQSPIFRKNSQKNRFSNRRPKPNRHENNIQIDDQKQASRRGNNK